MKPRQEKQKNPVRIRHQINIETDADTARAIKIAAAVDGVKIRDWVMHAIQGQIAEMRKRHGGIVPFDSPLAPDPMHLQAA